MRERLKLAQDILKQLRSDPRSDWQDVIEASERVLQADLESCPDQAARIAAHQRHMKVAEDLARFADKAAHVGGLSQADRELSRYDLRAGRLGTASSISLHRIPAGPPSIKKSATGCTTR